MFLVYCINKAAALGHPEWNQSERKHIFPAVFLFVSVDYAEQFFFCFDSPIVNETYPLWRKELLLAGLLETDAMHNRMHSHSGRPSKS